MFAHDGQNQLNRAIFSNSRRHDNLSVVDSCLVLADRVVIPLALKRTALQRFHGSHPCVNRVKVIARTFTYGLGTYKLIKAVVQRCPKC